MARLKALPSLEIIRGLKGIIDFYYWRGLPCARAWPRWRPARQSEASKAAALFFGAVVKSYSLLGDLPLAAYRQDAADQPRSARDLFVSGVFGKLHEADMSDFLGLLTECRDFLSALTAILGALDSIDTDQLVVNVDESVLPPLAATSTIQTTQLTALQKIDDLQNALKSLDLDRIIVKGESQLYSINMPEFSTRSAVISGDDGYIDSHDPAAPYMWRISSVAVRNLTTPVTRIRLFLKHAATLCCFHDEPITLAITDYATLQCDKWLAGDDVIRAYFIGGLAGDNCRIHLTGHNMVEESW